MTPDSKGRNVKAVRCHSCWPDLSRVAQSCAGEVWCPPSDIDQDDFVLSQPCHGDCRKTK